MANPFLPEKYRSLTVKLTSKRELTDQSVFENNMHLMVFAAMVGHSVSEDEYDPSKRYRGSN